MRHNYTVVLGDPFLESLLLLHPVCCCSSIAINVFIAVVQKVETRVLPQACATLHVAGERLVAIIKITQSVRA